MQSLTTKQFIEKAHKIHGKKYDYSKVNYKTTRNKVMIGCPEHGHFMQTPNQHTNSTHSQGCPRCGLLKKIELLRHTTPQFIAKATQTHGKRYNYSKVEYKGIFIKILIVCPLHGEFWQTPAAHLYQKCGCPKCARKQSGLLKRLSTKQFIYTAQKTHGTKYNYAKTNYKTMYTPVQIICYKHRSFKQLPGNHLQGSGCPKCGVPKTLTTSQFIERAKRIHGNKYDYSNSKYKRIHEKITIICKIHGNFNQIASDHLNGCGCPRCGGTLTLGIKEFLERALKIHGIKYSYSKVQYKNNSTKIILICPKHGNFLQTPARHLHGGNCPKCNKITTSQFIERAKRIHGNKYDYSQTKYRHSCKNVIIVCPKHGVFKQIAHHHLEGSNCPTCALIASQTQQSTLTTQKFIEKAHKIHGNLFDYSNTNYKNGKSKVIITCKKHGDFNMRASTHLEGQGCPICRKSKGELKIEKWLIKNNINYIGQATFSDCRGKKFPLRFDFYLPKYNTCIEFDGPQHFEKCSFFIKDPQLRDLRFAETQRYDSIKTQYCLTHNIDLIRIKSNQIKYKKPLNKILHSIKGVHA